MRTLHSGTASVDYLGVLHASGEDARQFLHSQLSQDFMLLGHDKARLAAFLSAKGRMQASFIGLRHGAHDVLLLVDKSLLASVQKRLSMFILRAKVKLTDASQDWKIQGLIGEQSIACAAAQAPTPLTPWSLLTLNAPDGNREPSYLIGLYPAQDQARALHLVPAVQALPAPSLPTNAWRLSEVESGVATLSAAVVEQFVPQMLNYESIGGVNFKKGCYPGQEVVARSQFRGAIKRRAYIAEALAPEVRADGTNTAFAAGDEIYLRSEPVEDGQPCGLVVQTALREDGTQIAIVSIQTASAQTPLEVRPHTPEAAEPVRVAIEVRAMPYPILEDI